MFESSLPFNVRFEQRGHVLVSQDYVGYSLAVNQQLQQLQQLQQDRMGREGPLATEGSYTWLEFTHYLVLERGQGLPSHTSSCARRPDCLVLVPVGDVCHRQPDPAATAIGRARVQVAVPSDCDARCKVHSYERHSRFGDLRATSRLARLQLAALHAATSSLLPEPHSRLTGAQTALKVLRQCWGNSPLTPDELLQLQSIPHLGGHLLPALKLLAHELLASASQLSHLHEIYDSEVPPLGTDSQIHYFQRASPIHGWCGNSNVLLAEDEESRALNGLRRPKGDAPPSWFRNGDHQVIEIGKCPVDVTFVTDFEQEVASVVSQAALRQGAILPFPLVTSSSALPLEVSMMRELNESWVAHHITPISSISATQVELLDKINDWQVGTIAGLNLVAMVDNGG